MQIASSRISDMDDGDRIFNRYEDNSFQDYLRDKYEKTTAYLEKASTGIARQFLDRSRKIFDSYNSSEALRRTRQAIRSAKGIKNSNSIHTVTDLKDLQTVGYKMQRFLMADPVIRTKYHQQRVDGYSDSYVDMHKGDIGRDHYDWRRVNDGIFREELDESGEQIFVHERFFEELVEGDRDLDAVEQFDVLDAQDIQRLFMEAGFDTSNRLGGKIG